MIPTPFDPLNDRDDLLEAFEDYRRRMQAGPLPNWPTEVLAEWLYRHWNQVADYAFLGFPDFHFERQRWPLPRVPGREAVADPGFCDSFDDVDQRAATNPHDWLAHDMLGNGTWNTPVILLSNSDGMHTFPSGEPLKSPYHLLEGHRRLSFLTGLRRLGKASPEHDVWIVTAKPA